MAKNVDYDTINISIVAGDTWKQTYSVKKNNVLLDMTGMILAIDVEDEDGVEVLNITTAGLLPAITISTTTFTINKAAAFSVVGKYYYDIQLTDLTAVVSTICRGKIKVIKEYTD